MNRKRKVGRKPMDKLNGYDSREAMWAVIREKQTFMVRDIHQETTLDISTVRDYIRGLANAGYLSEEGDISGKVFTLIRDIGIDAPKVRKDGSAVTQGQGQVNMWKAMRTLQVFSPRDLAVNASTRTCTVQQASAEGYCRHLCHAGYLRQDDHGSYFFIPHMYSGPKPPMIQRVKRVWDQNLKKVMWSDDGQGRPNAAGARDGGSGDGGSHDGE